MGRYKNNKDGTKTLIAGRGNTDAIESQIGYVEATDTATSAHAVGSYFINKTGQFVKTTSAIAVGDTIAVGTNCQATDIAGVLTALNSDKQNATDNSLTTTSKTIVGAINEINDGYKIYHGASDTNWYSAAHDNAFPTNFKGELENIGNCLDSAINRNTIQSGVINISDLVGGSFGAVVHVMSPDWFGGIILGYRMGWGRTLIWFSYDIYRHYQIGCR